MGVVQVMAGVGKLRGTEQASLAVVLAVRVVLGPMEVTSGGPGGGGREWRREGGREGGSGGGREGEREGVEEGGREGCFLLSDNCNVACLTDLRP